MQFYTPPRTWSSASRYSLMFLAGAAATLLTLALTLP
jgi:hypothetical protein